VQLSRTVPQNCTHAATHRTVCAMNPPRCGNSHDDAPNGSRRALFLPTTHPPVRPTRTRRAADTHPPGRPTYGYRIDDRGVPRIDVFRLTLPLIDPTRTP
jgi:hypothetical protein